MNRTVVDAIVVGSGPSAVNAAYPLVEAGLSVRMLDVGNRDAAYERLIPPGPYAELRRTDRGQHRYFLGDRFEGIGFDHVGAGAQLTPPRQYVLRDADRLQPTRSSTFFPLQSLAEGGLGGAWGAGSPPFSEIDLAGMPLAYRELAPHYEAVAERIGVSGACDDDLLPFLGAQRALQPPVPIDSNGEAILARYARHRAALRRAGLYLGHPRLALLSRDHRGRAAHRGWDMDFWSDEGRSVYRPRWTLDELRRRPGFAFVARRLVRSFAERDGEVTVEAADVDAGTLETHRARALVLAAGTLGTTRIALRSLGAYHRRVPIVCNPHAYLALLNLDLLGKPVRDARHSMAQVCLVHAPGGPARPFTIGHIYSYRSLMLFRLMKDSPLPLPESLEVMRHLSPSFGVLILQHQDRPTPAKHATLVPGAGGEDQLELAYGLSAQEQQEIEDVERAVARGLRRLRCLRLRTIRPGHAASVHYAGTLPMSAGGEELTTDAAGRLARTRAVYVADGAVFPSLPSKGLTFTMMANADRVGSRLAGELRR